MSLYYYSFIEEAPTAAVTHFAIVGVAQAETAAGSRRLGPNSTVLHMATGQAAHMPTPPVTVVSPWSIDFSSQFGPLSADPWSVGFSIDFGPLNAGGTAIGRSLGSAMVSTPGLSTTKAHVYQATLTASTASVRRLARGAVRAAGVATLAVWAVAVSRFRGTVLASAEGNTARLARGMSHLSAIAAAEAAGLSRGSSRAFTVVSTESSTVNQGPVHVYGFAAANLAAARRGVGKILSASHTTKAVLGIGFGRYFSLAAFPGPFSPDFSQEFGAPGTSQSFGLLRQLGVMRSATSPEAVFNLLAGRLLARLFAFASQESTTVQRGLSTRLPSFEANSASLARGLSKLASSLAGSVAALSRQTGKINNAASSSSGGIRRAIGHPLFCLSISSAFVVTVGSHFSGLLSAALAQVVALTTVRSKGALVSAAQTQVAAAARNLTHTLLQALTAVQAEATSVVAAAKRTLLASPAATQAQAASVIRGMARFLSVGSLNLAAMVRGISHLIPVPTVQSPLMTMKRFALTPGSVVSSSVSLLAKSMNLGRGIAGPEVTATVSQRGRTLATFSGSTPGLRQLVGKGLLAVAQQAQNVVRLIGGKRLGATLRQAVSVVVPKGLVLRASQSQLSALVPWFHFFVQDWAKQQLVLLPPGGGKAEPPSFGPTDPADQTTFAFDWIARGNVSDPIVSAQVVSIPPGLSFFGPPFISGSLVEITVSPFVPVTLPVTYSLRCSVVFASGRRSSFSIPMPVRFL